MISTLFSNKISFLFTCGKDFNWAEFQITVSETACWDPTNILKISGSENRRRNSEIYNDDIFSPFFLILFYAKKKAYAYLTARQANMVLLTSAERRSVSAPGECRRESWMKNLDLYQKDLDDFISYAVFRIRDPDSIRSVNPYPDPDPEGQKWPTKTKKIKKFMFWSAGCSLLRAEGFYCSLDVLYGGLGIGKLDLISGPNGGASVTYIPHFLFFPCF